MKERPILFSAPMVRALLAGRKTQTRRVAPLESVEIKDFGEGTICWAAQFSKPLRSRISGGMSTATYSGGPFTGKQAVSIIAADFCPYGAPGDRLWVRETWMDLQGTGVEVRTGDRSRYAYGADTPPGSYGDGQRISYGLKWKPSIHMPRAACRLVLEITDVRVERLMSISEEDARAEGVDFDPGEGGVFWVPGLGCASDTAADSFRRLWESINGAGSWMANPWVWAVEFKRTED